MTAARTASSTLVPSDTLEKVLEFGPHRIPYYAASGPRAWDEFTRLLGGLAPAPDRFALVTSEGVPRPYVERMTRFLRAAATAKDGDRVVVLQVEDGEQNKTLGAVGTMAVTMSRAGFTPRSAVVVFGGAMAGNIATVLATLWHRGVRIIQCPTTQLAVFDGPGCSLKGGVNLFDETGEALGKNLLGCLLAPEFVWCDTDLFHGLPPDQVRSFVGEVIKTAVAICPEQIPELQKMIRPAADYTPAEILQLGGIVVGAKQSVMRYDHREQGTGLACELAHTALSNAIELLWGLPHGIAVAIGTLIALRVSVKLGLLRDLEAETIVEDLVRRNGVEPMLPPGPSDAAILGIAYRDKLRGGHLEAKDGHLDMVLLDDLGVLHYTGDHPVTQVPESIFLEAFHSRIREKEHAPS